MSDTPAAAETTPAADTPAPDAPAEQAAADTPATPTGKAADLMKEWVRREIELVREGHSVESRRDMNP